MTLNLEVEKSFEVDFDYEEVAKKVINAALDFENCPYETEVNLLLTDDMEICKINKEYRDIDRATDVLSFPMVEYNDAGDFDPIEMPPLMFLTKSRSKVNPKEVKNVHLIPRTNNVELRFRNGANDITIILDSAERNKIFEELKLLTENEIVKNILNY